MVLLHNTGCCPSLSDQLLSDCIWAGLAAMQMTGNHDEVMMLLLSLFAQLPASCECRP